MFQAHAKYPIHEDMLVAYEKQAYQKALAYANQYYPLEFLLVPICGLILREDISPLRVLELQDIGCLVVVDYILPPFQVNQGGHTSVRRDKRQEASDIVTGQLDELRKKHPRLGQFCKFHSHPFAGGRFLSGGDISHNLVGNPLAVWQQDKGMRDVPMQVIWPVGNTWNITTFLYLNQTLHVCPPPRIMEEENSRYAKVYNPAFFTGNNWVKEQKALLRERWEKTTTKDLGRGWMQMYVPTKQVGYLLCLPPDFPQTPFELWMVPNGREPFYMRNVQLEEGMTLGDVDMLSLVDKLVRGAL